MTKITVERESVTGLRAENKIFFFTPDNPLQVQVYHFKGYEEIEDWLNEHAVESPLTKNLRNTYSRIFDLDRETRVLFMLRWS